MAEKLLYSLLIVLAALAAVACYCHFRYPAAALVLQIRTLEKGYRKIETVDGYGGVHERRFEIGNDQGEPSFYVVGLPRVIPREIRIDPLAGNGKFEVDRITLRNEDMSFSWDSNSVCASKRLQNGRIRRDACSEGQLLLKTAENSRLSITGIPQSAFSMKEERGIVAGFFAFIGVFLSGLWLCRGISPDVKSGAKGVLLSRAGWLVVLSLYLAQFYAIWLYSVDVPFWEEWEYFLPEGLPKGLSWEWLFSFAGYHRVVPTKLLAWLNLQLFGLDFRLQKLLNYVIFAGLLLTVCSLKNRVTGRGRFMMFPVFLLFLLSPIMYENHSNSYQSQIHLVLIFALLALCYAYADRVNASVALFLIFLSVAINTFSAGMTIAAVCFSCWALFVVVQIVGGQISRLKGGVFLFGGGSVVALAALSWISGYRQPSDCVWISPLSGQFWDTFLNLLSFGFGFELEHPLPGIACLLVVICPVVLLWRDGERRREKGVWLLTTGILCMVAILATISITRGCFIGTSKASRYAEFGVMLVPLTSIAWWLALRRPVQRHAVLLLLWGACFVSFFDDWSYSPYRDGGQMDLFVLEALEEYTLGHGDGAFPWSHPKPLPPFFEGARGLDVKFTRQFTAGGNINPRGYAGER